MRLLIVRDACARRWMFEPLDIGHTLSLSRKKRFVVPPSLSLCSLCLGGHASACKVEIDSMVEKCNHGLLAHRELQPPPLLRDFSSPMSI